MYQTQETAQAGEERGKLGSDRKIALTVLLIIVIGLAANVLITFVSNIEPTLAFVGAAPWHAFLVPFAAVMLCYGLDAFRLSLVARTLGYRIPKREAFMNSVLGFFGSYITPSATGGQFMQVYHLSHNGIDAKTGTNVMASRFVEFILFSTAVVAFSAWRLPALFGKGVFGTTVLVTGLTVSVLFSVAICVVFYNVRILFHVLDFAYRILYRKRPEVGKAKAAALEDWIAELRDSIHYLWIRKFGAVLLDFALGAVSVVLQAWSLLYALGAVSGFSMNLLDFTLLFVLMNFVAYYIPTPGAAGSVEGIYSLVLSGFSETPSAMTAGVIVWRLASFYFHLVFQMLYLVVHRALIANGKKSVRLAHPLEAIRAKREALRAKRGHRGAAGEDQAGDAQ